MVLVCYLRNLAVVVYIRTAAACVESCANSAAMQMAHLIIFRYLMFQLFGDALRRNSHGSRGLNWGTAGLSYHGRKRMHKLQPQTLQLTEDCCLVLQTHLLS